MLKASQVLELMETMGALIDKFGADNVGNAFMFYKSTHAITPPMMVLTNGRDIHVEVTVEQYRNLHREWRSGNKILSIKLLREYIGVNILGLKEAKDIIEHEMSKP